MNKEIPNIFFNTVQKKILKLFFLNSDSEFNTNEIIKLTKSGTGAVQRELKKFISSGLINCQNVGNQKRYKANPNLSYYKELKSIIIKTFGLSDILKESLQSNVKQVIIAFIYGSFATQTETANSDVDLLLIGKDLTYADVFQVLEDTEKLIGRKVNPSIYSPKEWIQKYRKGNNFIEGVIKQPKIFLIGSEDEFKEFR